MLVLLEIIAYSISIAFILLLFLACFFTGTGLMKVVGAIIKFLSYPLRKLWDAVSNLLDKCAEAIADGRKSVRFDVFGGFRGFLMFVCLILFASLGSFNVYKHIITHIEDLEELIFTILDNTVLGGFLMMLKGWSDAGKIELTQVTMATLMAVGFSAGVSAFCSRPIENAKWYIRFIAGIFSLVAMVVLAIVLKDVFESAGNWAHNTFISLFEQRGGNVFDKLKRIVLLVIFGYFAVLTLLLVIEQYLSFLAFFPLSISVYGVISVGIQWLMQLLNAPEGVRSVTNGLLTIAIFIAVEVLRSRYDKFAKGVMFVLCKIFKGKSKKSVQEVEEYTC